MEATGLNHYIDATFLKTEEEGFSSSELKGKIDILLKDAEEYDLKCVMIRPEFVSFAHDYLKEKKSNTLVGTVIDFPKGHGGLDIKIAEAEQAIADAADELDFVMDYTSFQKGDREKVEKEVLACTLLALEHHKTVKWIIETAALSTREIVEICSFIKRIIIKNFRESDFEKIFVKSSTGYYKTDDGSPSGATFHNITLMLENAAPLPVKASGGVSDRETARQMIALGVSRIGTSSYENILKGNTTASSGY